MFTFSLENNLYYHFQNVSKILKGQALASGKISLQILSCQSVKIDSARLVFPVWEAFQAVLVRDTWTDARLPWVAKGPTPCGFLGALWGPAPGPAGRRGSPLWSAGPSASRRTWWSLLGLVLLTRMDTQKPLVDQRCWWPGSPGLQKVRGERGVTAFLWKEKIQVWESEDHTVLCHFHKKKKSGANVHYKMDGTFSKDLIFYVCILVY